MIELNKNHLYLITAEFPYGAGESFIENEIQILSKRFNKVILIPISNGNGKSRKIPENCEISDVLFLCPVVPVKKIWFSHFSYISKLLLSEFIHTNKRKFFLSNIREINSILSQTLYKSKLILKMLKQGPKDSRPFFYSFWMNEGALIYSILKERGDIDSFVFRVLGYDLYDERREGGYMPFRYFNFKMAKQIFCISKDGFNYLKRKNIFPEKLFLSYLSVFDNGKNYFKLENTFTLVSCSNLIPLKRVHLIIEILKEINFDIHWIHFGDGVLMEDLKEKAKSLPSNISFDFKGQINNQDILKFYKENQVNLFIHLSETEGGAPVALQEAASFGIPLLGTNAGGIPEIVTEETGFLIPVNFEISRVVEIISEFKNGSKNSPEFREIVRNYWFNNFNAEINYNRLCDKIIDQG
jgi:glycosyltransferase involved in cell wall biosynthesis